MTFTNTLALVSLSSLIFLQPATTFGSDKFLSDPISCDGIFFDQIKDNQASIKSKSSGKIIPTYSSLPIMVLTQFKGEGSFSSARIQNWESSTGGLFHLGSSTHSTLHGYTERDNILADKERFTLTKYFETGYQSPAELNYYLEVGPKLIPRQVHFLEIVHNSTVEEVQANYGDPPRDRILSYMGDDYEVGKVTVKTAALFSVSGQIWDPNLSRPKLLELPWQLKKSRLGQVIDRKAHPYLFEWGRAASDIPKEIHPLFGANTLLNYLEVKAYGGNIDEAFIMFHSFNEANSRYYLTKHPGSIYPHGWTNLNDALFLVPLAEAMEKYSADKFSALIEKIKKLSAGGLSTKQAIDLAVDMRLHRWDELDFTAYPEQRFPLILHDQSNAWNLNLDIEVKSYGLSGKAREDVGNAIIGVNPLFHTSNDEGKYEHAADATWTSRNYFEANAVEISNLDPEIAKKNSDYALNSLLASFDYYLSSMAKKISTRFHIPYLKALQYVTKLVGDHKVNFGITTGDPEIIAQIKKLNPDIHQIKPATVYEDGRPINDPDLVRSNPFYYKRQEIFIFTFSKVVQIVLENQKATTQMKNALKPGKWRTRYILDQIDLF